jgi:hypothetical protein
MANLTKEYFDKQLKGTENKIIKHVDEKIGKVSARVDNLSTHVDKQIGGLSTRIDVLSTHVDKQIGGISTRIDNLSTHIDEEIASLAGMTSRRFDELERKLDVREKVEKLEMQMKQVREALSL